MAKVKRKGGVEISKEGQHLKICVPSFSTRIIVYPEDKMHFIRYLKYIYNKCNTGKLFYRGYSTIQYREDQIFLGNHFSVKYPFLSFKYTLNQLIKGRSSSGLNLYTGSIVKSIN